MENRHPLLTYCEREELSPDQFGALLDPPVHRATLYRWIKRGVPQARLVEIFKLTGIPGRDLRPDLVDVLNGAGGAAP